MKHRNHFAQSLGLGLQRVLATVPCTANMSRPLRHFDVFAKSGQRHRKSPGHVGDTLGSAR